MAGIRRASPSPPAMEPDRSSVRSRCLPEHTRFQPRRTPTLVYQSSGARDARDRSHSHNHKNLVVVIPPPDFPLHQKQLGHVLSMGPPHRLSQGILMPLFPSMFGQLNAIAREYHFPSIAGICVYLHMNENGITMTPRISDDSWQYLFGHLFEPRPPSSSQQLPIGGSIEFDIDLTRARWFDAWVSGTLRDPVPFPPTAASQVSHRLGESQTINTDSQPAEEHWDASGSHTLVSNSRPETLHQLPRKLSLVDRLESLSHHTPLKLRNRSDNPDPPPAHETSILSPSPQSAFPRVAKTDLEQRVNSWRETTDLYQVSMTETYQPALDVEIHMGATAMDEYALERTLRPTAKIAEFIRAFMQPSSPVMNASTSSLHLDRCSNGTVPLTPTSWGPPDDESYSAVSSVSRLPSLDIGERMVEDTTVQRLRAVWGNSFGWRSARTWKEVYPYSTFQAEPMVQVQVRGSDTVTPQYPNFVIYQPAGSHSDAHSSSGIFSHFDASTKSVWGNSFGWQRAVTWRKVYPHSITTVTSVASIQLSRTGGLASGYPNICIYPAIYPYFEIYPARAVKDIDILRPVSVVLNTSDNLARRYPTLVIYPFVYPHFDVYHPVLEDAKMEVSTLVNTGAYSPNRVSTLYPNFVIYPTIYPHFDLYPKALQINDPPKPREVDVEISRLIPTYLNITTHPNAYSCWDVHSEHKLGIRTPNIAWGISFGWQVAKTWFQVYPLHTAAPPTTRQVADGPSISSPGLSGRNQAMVDTLAGKQAIWGSSFGWKNATTWCAVWPTTSGGNHPNYSPTFVHLGQQSKSTSKYPTYPGAFSSAAGSGGEGSLAMENSQCNISLIPSYPTLTRRCILTSMCIQLLFASHVKKNSPIFASRRVEMWRAKTAAQVGLAELLAHNHIWETDEPLQIDLDDYAWSQTSAGPPSSPVGSPSIPSIPRSVHIDRRIQGSVLLTPSTATSWAPQDNDNIERLPYPDLGWRALDDASSVEPPHKPWHSFFRDGSQVNTHKKSILVQEHSHPVNTSSLVDPNLDSPAYPRFELYPARENMHDSKNQAAETLASSHCYPILDIYPAVYPHFNIYPAVDLQELPNVTPNIWHERVEVKLPSLYPNIDVYRGCYPYNLNSIYPSINVTGSTSTPIEGSRRSPRTLAYPLVYPHVTPYPDFLAEVGPSIPQQSPCTYVIIKLPVRYPRLDIYPAVYPWSLESIYPAVSVDDYPRKPQHHAYDLTTLSQKIARTPISQTYSPLNTEALQDDLLDEHNRDLASSTSRGREDEVITAIHSPDKEAFPLWQLPALSPIPPLRVHIPGTPSTLSPPVSETPASHVGSPTSTSGSIHKRTMSSRFTQAVKSMMPKVYRRHSSTSTTPGSPPSEEHVKDQPSPTRFRLPLIDRRSYSGNSESPGHAPQRFEQKDSSVLQRARAYEQAIANRSSNTDGTKGMFAPPTMRSTPPTPPMTDADD